jgi:hypothetical protein
MQNKFFVGLALTCFCFKSYAQSKLEPTPLDIQEVRQHFVAAAEPSRKGEELADPVLMAISEKPAFEIVGFNYDLESTNAELAAKIFNYASKRNYDLPEVKFQIVGASISNGRALVYGYDQLGVWNSVGQKVKFFKNKEGASANFSAALSKDAEDVFIGLANGKIRKSSLTPKTLNKEIEVFDKIGRGLLVSHDGKTLMAASEDDKIAFMDTRDFKVVRKLDMQDVIKSLKGLRKDIGYSIYNSEFTFSQDDSYVVVEIGGHPINRSGNWYGALVRLSVDGSKEPELVSQTALKNSFYSIDGPTTYVDEKGNQMLAFIGTNYEKEDRRVFVVNLTTGKDVANYKSEYMLKFDTLGYETIGVSAEGRYLATPSTVGLVGIIDQTEKTFTPIQFTDEDAQSIDKMFFKTEDRKLSLVVGAYSANVYVVKVK